MSLVLAPTTLSRLSEVAVRAPVLGWVVTVAILTVGLPAAIFGQFHPGIVMPVTAMVAFVLWRPLARQSSEIFSIAGAGPALLVAALIVVASLGTNVVKASQHLATNRDPGVYLETGLWLADQGNLELDGREGPFLEHPELLGGGLGFTEFGDRSQLHAQFGHGTAVLIGVGSWFGGSRVAVRIPALLSAVGLFLWWSVLRRVSSPWWATVGTAALAVNLVFIHFSRDTFSEPLAFLLLAGATLVLTTSSSPLSWGAAGWVLGLSVAARIDMIMVVFGAAVLALLWSPTKRGSSAALAIGAASGTALAMVDLGLRSPEYLEDRWSALAPPLTLSGLLAVAALSGAAAGPRVRRLLPPRPSERSLKAAAGFGGALIVLAAFYALLIRPETVVQYSGFSGHIAGLQAREGLEIDGTRTYGENAMVWLTWYAGIGAVVLAVAGLVLGLTRLTRARAITLVAPLVLLVPMSVLYLQRPRITGDQIWAMRRFFPTMLPLLILLACMAGAWLGSVMRDRAGLTASRTLQLVAAGVLLLPPALVSWPARSDRTILWASTTIESLCETLGDDAAALILDQGLLGSHLVNSTRRVCKIPTARGTLGDIDLVALSSAWADEGRRLVVLEYAGWPIEGLIESNRHPMPQSHLERTLERLPEQISAGTRQVSVWRFPD